MTACWLLFRQSPLSSIRGPKPEFFFGNVRQIVRQNNVEVLLAWAAEFGSVFRFRSLMGRDKLIVSDPRLVQYVLGTATYDFPKPAWLRAFSRAFLGPDIVCSEGNDHKRQRKVISPAFGHTEVRALFPVFRSVAVNLGNKWHDIVQDCSDKTCIDVHDWLSRATLDAIGEAAFEMHLGTMGNPHSELAEIYRNFNVDSTPASRRLLNAVLDFIPVSLIFPVLNRLPLKQIVVLQEHKKWADRVARELVSWKMAEFREGKGKRDVFSLLVKANASMQTERRLTKEEFYAQMSTMFFAGHDTIASTLTWALWLLASHEEAQSRLREEIKNARSAARVRGVDELEFTDIENMAYLQAFLKETLRLYPTVFQTSRVASKDSVLPLSRAIETTDGRTIDQIHVPAGTEIIIAIGSYNRDKTIWGDDANEFNPDRWLKGEVAVKHGNPIGVIGNLLTFSSGTRACIGWRFAMAEMQSFLVELIDRFEIRPQHPKQRVCQWGDNLTSTLVDGEEDKGAELNLSVSLASRD